MGTILVFFLWDIVVERIEQEIFRRKLGDSDKNEEVIGAIKQKVLICKNEGVRPKIALKNFCIVKISVNIKTRHWMLIEDVESTSL